MSRCVQCNRTIPDGNFFCDDCLRENGIARPVFSSWRVPQKITCATCGYCSLTEDDYAQEVAGSGKRILFECMHPDSPVALTCIYREGGHDITNHLQTFSCVLVSPNLECKGCYTCIYYMERDGYNSCLKGFLFKPYVYLDQYCCASYARK